VRVVPADETALTEAVVSLATEYGRYGYRRITALLRAEGWQVNAKRVERIWRREGLKVPRRQPKRGRLWLNDGSCIRLRPCWPGHVWAYDFVQDRTHDGRRFRMLTVIDEYTRECLAIVVARRLTSDDVLQVLTDLFVERGPPGHIRCDNGPEFVAKVVRGWLGRVGVTTLFVEPGSPWENGYNESFNGKLRGGSTHCVGPGPGDLLFAAGLSRKADQRGADRALAPALQHGQAAQRAGLSAAGAGSGVALAVWPRLRSAPAGPAGQARTWAKSLIARGSSIGGRSVLRAGNPSSPTPVQACRPLGWDCAGLTAHPSISCSRQNSASSLRQGYQGLKSVSVLMRRQNAAIRRAQSATSVRLTTSQGVCMYRSGMLSSPVAIP
jgi:transposase InsO family protein